MSFGVGLYGHISGAAAIHLHICGQTSQAIVHYGSSQIQGVSVCKSSSAKVTFVPTSFDLFHVTLFQDCMLGLLKRNGKSCELTISV